MLVCTTVPRETTSPSDALEKFSNGLINFIVGMVAPLVFCYWLGSLFRAPYCVHPLRMENGQLKIRIYSVGTNVQLNKANGLGRKNIFCGRIVITMPRILITKSIW